MPHSGLANLSERGHVNLRQPKRWVEEELLFSVVLPTGLNGSSPGRCLEAELPPQVQPFRALKEMTMLLK